MLEVYAAEYDDGTSRSYALEKHFRTRACIPCTPDGTTLRYCKSIISPAAPFAGLFDSNETWFPIQEFVGRHLVCSALENLGMICDILPWEYIIERAQTVSKLFMKDHKKALNRIKLLIKTLENHMPKQPPPMTGTTIDSVEFLPVLTKPLDYQLPWQGQSYYLSSGQNLLVAGTSTRHAANNTIISGSQVKFVCEDTPELGGCGQIRSETLKVLHIRTSPTCKEVLRHLKLLVVSYNTMEKSKELIEWCDRLCRQVYAFFDDKITVIREASESNHKLSAPSDLNDLVTFACIWNGNTFLDVKSIARNWKLNGPYLFTVPASLAYRRKLSAYLNIKNEFSIEDVQQALIRMKNDFRW